VAAQFTLLPLDPTSLRKSIGIGFGSFVEARVNEAAGMQQRLAAILAADAAGFSRLMAHDEQATVQALDQAREAFRTAILAHAGRVIDMAGDSVLAVFDTAVGAALAALDVHRVLGALTAGVPADRQMRFRVGVHLGDVIVKPDGSVYGDGVNIAARLQALALPGGITVSDAVRSSLGNRVAATFEDLGEQHVKNIPGSVHALRMQAQRAPGASEESVASPAARDDKSSPAGPSAVTRKAQASRWLTTSWRAWLTAALTVVLGSASVLWWARSDSGPPAAAKSIAVLPFVDMSERRDQEYFADGLTEELIGQLSRAADLKVIARTSSFQFKGKNEDIRSIASKLGVAHVLEGSVRRAGGALRITAQLIRASDGTHIWSQTFDRSESDIFRTQDEIATTVAQALNVALDLGGAKANSRPPNLQAHNLVLEGDFFRKRSTKADNEHAIRLYKEAIELEPNYALAWVRLGDAYGQSAFTAWGSPSEDLASGRAAIDQALRIDPNLAAAHASHAWYLRTFDWDWQGGDAACRRARELDSGPPDLVCYAYAWPFGRLDEMIAVFRRQLAHDPLSTTAYWNLGSLLGLARRYAEAAEVFHKVLELNPSSAGAKAAIALTLLYQGKKAEALHLAEQEPDERFRSAVLPIVYWELGRRSDSDRALSHFESTYTDAAAYDVAALHAYRGEVDAAFAWLDRAYRQRDAGMQGVKVDPLLDNLRGDPRYHAWLVKMKLEGDGPSPQR
jgi:adenylate cyclase